MGLKLKGEAGFTHDGQDLKLAINVEVMMAAEQETGVDLLGLHGGILNMRLVASLLRHGLMSGCGKEITLGEAAEMLMEGDAAHTAVITAFEGFLPKPVETLDENPTKAA